METQAVVADSDGRGSASIWVAPDFCLRLWRWAIYLYPVLNQFSGVGAPALTPGQPQICYSETSESGLEMEIGLGFFASQIDHARVITVASLKP
jgi:hypothetical protein